MTAKQRRKKMTRIRVFVYYQYTPQGLFVLGAKEHRIPASELGPDIYCREGYVDVPTKQTRSRR